MVANNHMTSIKRADNHMVSANSRYGVSRGSLAMTSLTQQCPRECLSVAFLDSDPRKVQ